MEALIIILAELLIGPALALLTIVLEAFLVIVGLLVEFVGYLLFGRKQKKQQPQPASNAKQTTLFGRSANLSTTKTFKFGRTVKWIGFGTFAASIISLIAANVFFFEPIARYALSKVSERTGYTVDVTTIEGSFLSGSFEASGVSVKQNNPLKTQLAFNLDQFAGDLAVTTLLSKTIRMDTLKISGLRGDIRTVEKTAKKQKLVAPSQKRRFEISDFNIQDVLLNVAKGSGEPVEFSIKAASSLPLRSNWALFDLLFRSNIEASIDGIPLLIATESGERGRTTNWIAKDLPLASLSKLSSKAPINWLNTGTVDLNVADAWALGDKSDIDMDWQIVLSDARMVAPNDAGIISRGVMLPITRYVNSRNEPVDVSFSLVLNKDQFEYASSLDATGLWDAVADEISANFARATDRKKEDVKSKVDSFLGGIKERLGRDKNLENVQ